MKIKLILIICILSFACKKSKNGEPQKPPTILLTASLSNGHAANKFSYSADNKLIMLESYNEASPNTLVATMVIEYNQAGDINTLTSYSEPGHLATSRSTIDSMANGHIITTSQYDLQSATPNKPAATSKRTYNAAGRLLKVEWKDKNGKLISYNNVSYYASGTVKQIDSYDEESGSLYMVQKEVYAIPGGYIPKGLQALDEILGPQYTAAFINDSYQYFTYDQNGVIKQNRQYQYSAREYNSDSTLKRQTITIKKIKPAFEDEIVYKQYEYVTQ